MTSTRLEVTEIILPLKPFSANNRHYRGHKDTKEYRQFKADVKELMGGEYGVHKKDQLKLTLIAGFSNRASDLDNAFKPILDSMQLCMDFDDKQVYEIQALKAIVPKGEEYLYIKLEVLPSISYMNKIKRWLKRLMRQESD